MDNQRKIEFVQDLIEEIILRRGEDASHDQAGSHLAVVAAHLALARAVMNVSGSADGDQPDDGCDPDGDRDYAGPAICKQCDHRLRMDSEGRCCSCGYEA